jgi:hypothetical protein
MRETSQEMLTCSDPCKSWYKRWKKKNPGETLGPIFPTDEEWEAYQEQKMGGRRGVAGGSATAPSHEQAVISYEPPPGYKLIEEQMHDVLMHMLMTRATDGEKKSDFAGATLPPPRTVIDPATVKVTEVNEDKRREISINNAMAALDDF